MGRTLVWAAVLAVAAVLVVAVAVPRVTGATPYTVLTGSMRPELAPGSLVVVRPAEHEEIGIGDVVTFQLESGERAVVTHRVVAVTVDGRGETRFTTQGDANEQPDRESVRAVQVRGRVWYSVPHLGRLNSALTGEQRQLATYGVGGALVVYAGATLVSAARDRRRAGRARALDPAASS
ncbi:signal peptidase I [Nocardioides sp. SYSU DS0651]|uniref:signal peptidase I n=1 Tax=Nocardioides sp. SYSU DS0651 TaxID=3415955 RepID=UPI003F4BB9BA